MAEAGSLHHVPPVKFWGLCPQTVDTEGGFRVGQFQRHTRYHEEQGYYAVEQGGMSFLLIRYAQITTSPFMAEKILMELI
jgi:hypothetical protein